MRGQPLWFLGTLLIGWTGVRAVQLWPAVALPPTVPAFTTRADVVAPSVSEVVASRAIPRSSRHPSAGRRSVVSASPRVAPVAAGSRVAEATPVSGTDRKPPPAELLPPEPLPSEPLPIVPTAGAPRRAALIAPRSRWSGSGWLIARSGGAARVVSPLLGGSQAGGRLVYRLDEDGRLAGYARVAGGLNGGRADLAAGVQFRPRAGGTTFYAEARRYGRRLAPAAGMFGGGAVGLPGRLRLDGYGLVGGIVSSGVVIVADAQLRVTATVAGVELGAGTWGAGQPGASRLDVGPTISLPMRSGDANLRLTLDWRRRLAGNARPASGPALSLGADF